MSDLSQPCYYCDVRAGAACRDSRGRELTTTHAARGVTAADAFDNAACYDCCESEELSHTDVEDAIAEFVEGFLAPLDQRNAAAQITQDLGEVTVTAYVHAKVPDTWLASVVEDLAEFLAERFQEDFGDPNRNGPQMDEAAAVAAMLPVLAPVVAATTVWACEVAARRTYQASEVLAMMREHRPEWFEESAGG